jgi:hypothetical protein
MAEAAAHCKTKSIEIWGTKIPLASQTDNDTFSSIQDRELYLTARGNLYTLCDSSTISLEFS